MLGVCTTTPASTILAQMCSWLHLRLLHLMCRPTAPPPCLLGQRQALLLRLLGQKVPLLRLLGLLLLEVGLLGVHVVGVGGGREHPAPHAMRRVGNTSSLMGGVGAGGRHGGVLLLLLLRTLRQLAQQRVV